jgi:hypothetical protein
MDHAFWSMRLVVTRCVDQLTGTAIHTTRIVVPVTPAKLIQYTVHLLGFRLQVQFRTQASVRCSLFVVRVNTRNEGSHLKATSSLSPEKSKKST